MLGAGAALLAGAGASATVIPLRIVNGACLVPVLLDGRAAWLVLDTGAERSILSEAAVVRLGLRRDPWVGTTLRGAGGRLERHADAVITHAAAGGVALLQHGAAGRLSLPVTASDLDGADGLLGGDVLRHTSFVLDAAHARLVLLPQARPARHPGVVRLTPWRASLLLAPVTLDGRALVALIDTGASATLVNARGAYRLGLTAAAAAGDAAAAMAGIGGVSAGAMHRFARLQFGTLDVAGPRLIVVPVAEAAYDMTLGLDVLGRQPVVISYADLSLTIAPG